MKELQLICKIRKKKYRYISRISNKITPNYLKKSNFIQSMSSKGNAYDNAVIESFFGTLKCETIYLQKVRTLSDLIKIIDQYIYWYNHERIKLTLGGYSPIQFRLMNQPM